MKKFLLIPLLFVCLNAFSQNEDVIKYAALVKGTGLKKHLAIIAGEEMQGRETGTEGQRRAAAYIETQFKEMGLNIPEGMNGYQQFYPLYRDSMTIAELKIDKKTALYGNDYIIPASNNENGFFNSNNIVFAGYGIEDSAYSDYASINVKGKVLVIFLGEPKKGDSYVVTGTERSSEWTYPGVTKKLALAATKGAAGVFIINPVQVTFNERFVATSKLTNAYFPRKSKDKILNYALLSHAFAKTLLASQFDSMLLKAKGSIAFNKSDLVERPIKTGFNYVKHRTVIQASNVIGIIDGGDKRDEYVFVTAHYDHLGMRDGKIYYGADDDGSGTAAVIHLAEAFAKAKMRGQGPRRTMVFMTFSGEEKGLWGSEYYSNNPVYPLEKTSVDLNIDMIGRIDTERKKDDTLNYIYVVGHDKLSSDLPLINESMNKTYTNLVLDYKFDDPKDPSRIYFRSDHYNFARKNVPVLFFYDGMLKSDYHKPTDTIDKINFALYEKRARMIFHTAWDIANRDDMLKRDIPLPRQAMER